MTNTNTTDIDNETNINKKQEEQKKKDSSGTGLCAATLILSAILIMCMSIYEDRKTLGALYFGMSTLLLILLLYATLCTGYIISRHRIRKQIISKYGLMNNQIFKNRLENNKYCKWFKDSLLFILIMSIIFLLFIEIFINIILNNGSIFSEILPSLFYFVSDFFSGIETETVTYMSESKYIYPKSVKVGKGRSEISIYSYYMVNFRTGSGDLLTLSVSSDYLAEVRSYVDAKITYIPRTGIHVP